MGLPHVHDVLKQVCERTITVEQACASLRIAKTRLYELRGDYLKARAAGNADTWRPGISGGNHAAPWDEPIVTFLKSAIRNGYNYAFAASEVDRLYGVMLARSQVRHWAIREKICPAPKPPRLPAHVRRWQRQAVGELWQMDATPDHWFGLQEPSYPLLDMLDDCSRLQVGCAIYRQENVPAYLHFLHSAFIEYGLPLEIYVDQAGIFAPFGSDLNGAELRRFWDAFVPLAPAPRNEHFTSWFGEQVIVLWPALFRSRFGTPRPVRIQILGE